MPAKTKQVKFWVGSEGPFLRRVPVNTESAPFRWEEVQTGKVVEVISEAEVKSTTTVTEGDTDVSSSQYAAYRAAHFNAFHLGANRL